LTEQNSFEKHWRKRNAPEVSGRPKPTMRSNISSLTPKLMLEHRAQTNAHNNDRQDNPADVELDPYLAKVRAVGTVSNRRKRWRSPLLPSLAAVMSKLWHKGRFSLHAASLSASF
jgi:hypothetical protein